MNETLKKVLLPALIVLSLGQAAILTNDALDKSALKQSKYQDASPDNPVCLLENLGGVMYIILESDQKNQLYRGIRVVLFAQMPFEVSIRELNSRKDLRLIDCLTGQPK